MRSLPGENYLDHDVAYLLGMIVGRGTLTDNGSERRLVIDFPYRALKAHGLNETFDQPAQLQLAVYKIRSRVEQLVEADFESHNTTRTCQFVMQFRRNNISWRNLMLITEGNTSYRTSVVPKRIFEAPADIQREFVRGMADVCGFIRPANAFYGRHRVYVEIPMQNWRLPVELCRLLQVCLGVPVQCIQWNHPNTRVPNQPRKKLAPREHQVKIFAEAFLKVGFYVDYKQRILEQLAEANSQFPPPHPCNPNPKAHQQREKLAHPGEKSSLIPESIRGMHFNGYYEICTEMGCRQFRPIDPSHRESIAEHDDE